jgi:predicted transcriptional regulator
MVPETPEAHKEIVEIKKEVRDIKQTQDAEIHQNRPKWEGLLFNTLGDNTEMMRVLLSVDGAKSAKDIEKEAGIYQMKCWRLLDKLERNGIVFKLEETKKGSPVYLTSRWYRLLRLYEDVQRKLASLSQEEKLAEGQQRR